MTSPPTARIWSGRTRALVSSFPVLFTLALLAAPTAASETVELARSDGDVALATLWSNDSAAPAVLLLPECDRDRSMFEDLGSRFAAAGFRVLAVDRPAGASDADTSDADTDEVEAAYGYLTEQSEDPGVVGVLGAGCAGGRAIALASSHSIRLLGLLSAPLSSTEERDAMQLRSSSMLLITTKGDRASNQPAAALAYRRRDAAKLFLYDGDARGAALLETDPELLDRIVDWFSSQRAN